MRKYKEFLKAYVNKRPNVKNATITNTNFATIAYKIHASVLPSLPWSILKW